VSAVGSGTASSPAVGEPESGGERRRPPRRWRLWGREAKTSEGGGCRRRVERRACPSHNLHNLWLGRARASRTLPRVGEFRSGGGRWRWLLLVGLVGVWSSAGGMVGQRNVTVGEGQRWRRRSGHGGQPRLNSGPRSQHQRGLGATSVLSDASWAGTVSPTCAGPLAIANGTASMMLLWHAPPPPLPHNLLLISITTISTHCDRR
jgi:hypothetical protein